MSYNNRSSSIYSTGHYNRPKTPKPPMSKYQKLLTTFVIFIPILFLGIFISVAVFASKASTIHSLEFDHKYNMNLISVASKNSDYITKASITRIERNEKYNTFAIHYNVRIIGTQIMSGFTPAVFTENEISGLEVNSEIDVATFFPANHITPLTSSIPMLYANKEISDIPEYKDAMAAQTNGKTATAIFGTLAGMDIILVIIFSILSGKNKLADAENRLNQDKKIDAHNRAPRCSYCGSSLDGSRGKCPNCGARSKKSTTE